MRLLIVISILLIFANCGMVNHSTAHTTVLMCESLGTDEYDIPKAEVYFLFDDQKIKVGDAQACDVIPKQHYERYDIPKNALRACGGWYAGSGDYYYYAIEDGCYVVYYRVLDEAVNSADSKWTEVLTVDM